MRNHHMDMDMDMDMDISQEIIKESHSHGGICKKIKSNKDTKYIEYTEIKYGMIFGTTKSKKHHMPKLLIKENLYWILSEDKERIICKKDNTITFPSYLESPKTIKTFYSKFKLLKMSHETINEFKQIWFSINKYKRTQKKATFSNGKYWDISPDYKYFILKAQPTIKISTIKTNTNTLAIIKATILCTININNKNFNEFTRLWLSIQRYYSSYSQFNI